MVPNPPHEKHARAAYTTGWNAAGVGAEPHDRPNYLTHEEREAHVQGWNDRFDLVVNGYLENPAKPVPTDAQRTAKPEAAD